MSVWASCAAGLAAQTSVPSPTPWAVRGGGTWVVANGIVRQTDNRPADPSKFVVPGLHSAGDQSIVAQVRVDSFPDADSRAGVSLRSDEAGRGYNFVLIPGNRVALLADGFGWGGTCAFDWAYGRWYWMRLTIAGGTLTGRIWAHTQTEAQATVCVQAGWTFFAAGAPGLNGGSRGETVSFDNATIGTFADGFDADGPPTPPLTVAGVLTTGDFAAPVHARAGALGFDLHGFIDVMQATAQRLVCEKNPGVCQDYTPGTLAVVPSPFYAGGTWMRDAAWTLGAVNDAGLLASLTSKFAAASSGAGQIPTLITNTGAPWFGAGGHGNPLPDDDSHFMFAIAARLGWQTVERQPYVQEAYSRMRGRAAPDGRYPATSHAWMDSFYPLGTSGPASVTVSSTMQGLYAVALRALRDLGVDVPADEIAAANAQYAALTVDGRLRAFEGSAIVSVSSLAGEALSLLIWNEPILPSAVVRDTIASFAEVHDPDLHFVGYKVLSAADGSFLAPDLFPVDNAGDGSLGGDYQNGGSWLLYDALALYAGARHDLPALRDTYVDRLVRRMAAEMRAGFGDGPVSKSHEFLCTAPGNPGDPCQPAGSAVPERADYGWNAFVVRLLADESPVPSSACEPVPAGQSTGSPCPVITASPFALRGAAVKAGAAGGLLSVTPAQQVTVLPPAGATSWTATANQPWIQITGGAGTGAGQFTVAVINPVNVIGGATSLSAAITVTPSDPNVAGAVIPVSLAVNHNWTSTVGPFGQVDTPVDQAAGVVGSIAVTGWALDDVGVSGVEIYRPCLPFEAFGSCGIIEGHHVVFVGDATFVAGARPDVEAAFPDYPLASRAGWGYLLLTPMLPHMDHQQPHGGQGSLTLYAFAIDVEGHRRLLGRSWHPSGAGFDAPTRIEMANDTIAQPFGAIDTPRQGETIGGMVTSFGWALTPDANTTAGDPGDIVIPPDGSTITVFVDGQPAGTVTYNQCRGTVGTPPPPAVFCDDDVANIFGNVSPQPPGAPRASNPTRYRNLDAGRGAIGHAPIDTTTLANGVHTIEWVVTDSAGARSASWCGDLGRAPVTGNRRSGDQELVGVFLNADCSDLPVAALVII